MKCYIMSSGRNQNDDKYYKIIKAPIQSNIIMHTSLLDNMNDAFTYDYYYKKYVRGILNISNNSLYSHIRMSD